MISKQFYCKLDAVKLGLDTSNEVLRLIGSRTDIDEGLMSLRRSTIQTIIECQRVLREHVNIDASEIQVIKNDEN